MTSINREHRYSFIVSSIPAGGGHRTAALFRCVDCNEIHTENIPSGRKFNAEAYVNSTRDKGWSVHLTDRRAVKCPTCARKPKPRNDVDSEIRKVIPMAPPAPPIREATAQQRVSIRGLLDKHFDDAVGCYLDGYSDAKIAETVNVPRVIVERIRESAYGPIKVNPDVLAAKTEAAALATELAALKERVDALVARVDKALAA